MNVEDKRKKKEKKKKEPIVDSKWNPGTADADALLDMDE